MQSLACPQKHCRLAAREALAQASIEAGSLLWQGVRYKNPTLEKSACWALELTLATVREAREAPRTLV